ncbi:dnaJ homolog subfamily C member 17 [Episyrphus balteatus]|uniref:dnaJ homolog subfamily C member 17 n=1 Tax=Episyrphus balteatus TaxID=286459 RepID=UPI0024868CD5|nr:dnaJ homolog subfamily C member 17 [Episyrphus balteatus]
MSAEFAKLNLYEYIGVDIDAQESDIRKAYRKKALACHPDKNPDNPKAAETFHILSRALEVLTDATARAAYDKVFKAKKAAEVRNQQLDSKRQKLKADLEQRERDASVASQRNFKGYSTVQKTDEQVLQEQIDRLREEGSKLLEEELASMRRELKKTVVTQAPKFDSTLHRIKIKWKAEKNDPTNGGYSESKLMNYLKKYGEIEAFVMSKKNGSALVEFKSLESSEMALLYEKGDLSNCLSLEWITPPPKQNQNGSLNVGSSNDFESLVLRQLRQAEERKRLIEQMQKEDQDGS